MHVSTSSRLSFIIGRKFVTKHFTFSFTYSFLWSFNTGFTDSSISHSIHCTVIEIIKAHKKIMTSKAIPMDRWKCIERVAFSVWTIPHLEIKMIYTLAHSIKSLTKVFLYHYAKKALRWHFELMQIWFYEYSRNSIVHFTLRYDVTVQFRTWTHELRDVPVDLSKNKSKEGRSRTNKERAWN